MSESWADKLAYCQSEYRRLHEQLRLIYEQADTLPAQSIKTIAYQAMNPKCKSDCKREHPVAILSEYENVPVRTIYDWLKKKKIRYSSDGKVRHDEFRKYRSDVLAHDCTEIEPQCV